MLFQYPLSDRPPANYTITPVAGVSDRAFSIRSRIDPLQTISRATVPCYTVTFQYPLSDRPPANLSANCDTSTAPDLSVSALGSTPCKRALLETKAPTFRSFSIRSRIDPLQTSCSAFLSTGQNPFSIRSRIDPLQTSRFQMFRQVIRPFSIRSRIDPLQTSTRLRTCCNTSIFQYPLSDRPPANNCTCGSP